MNKPTIKQLLVLRDGMKEVLAGIENIIEVYSTPQVDEALKRFDSTMERVDREMNALGE